MSHGPMASPFSLHSSPPVLRARPPANGLSLSSASPGVSASALTSCSACCAIIPTRTPAIKLSASAGPVPPCSSHSSNCRRSSSPSSPSPSSSSPSIPLPTIHPLTYAGAALAFIALCGEATADLQMQRFKANRANDGKVCEAGLWHYSRHPNYFFESLIWWAFFIAALPSPHGWVTIVCRSFDALTSFSR